MKKKWLVILLALALVALPAFMGCAPDEPADDPAEPAEPADPDEPVDEEGQHWNLHFTTFWPDEDFQVAQGHREGWAQEIIDRVEGETNHTIEFTWHPGEALLGATEIYEGVADGAADIGTTCPNYTPGIFPVTETFELPGLRNDNALVSSMVFQEAFNTMDEVQAEYEDVKVMHFWATGPGDIMSQEPIHTLDDYQGVETRVAGGSVPVIEALGGTPTTMPMSESYLALDQGIVEAILSPTDTLKGFMLAEVTDYITKTPFLYNVIFMKVMNQDTWDSFPAEVQQIFEEVNEEYVYEYGVLRTEETEAGQDFAVEEFGHEVIELDADEEEKWLEAIEPVQEDYVEELNEQGYDGEQILQRVLELDERFSEEYGDYFD